LKAVMQHIVTGYNPVRRAWLCILILVEIFVLPWLIPPALKN